MRRSMHGRSIHAENLLVRLFSYSPREGRSALEDYCTECLAWCLRHSIEFRQNFVSQFAGKLNWVRGFGDAIDVHTQQSNPIGRFDLVIESVAADRRLVIECKVDCEVTESQLKNYRAELDEKNIVMKRSFF
jgi:hypothetical protein